MYTLIYRFCISILTISHIPKSTQNAPNLTDQSNVPKIEESRASPPTGADLCSVDL
jgi:hypothetical protein